MVLRVPDTGFTRVPYVARCRISNAGRRRHGTICNVSKLGVYVHVEPVPEGEVEIVFGLPDGGTAVEAGAQVTWVNDVPPENVTALPVGCGLRFTVVAPEDRQRIEELVEAFRREPEPLIGLAQPTTGRIRIPYVAPCTLVGPFGISQGSTCNLSSHGIYAAVDRIPDVGSTLEVAVRLPGRRDPFEREGVVTWQNLDRPERPHALPPGCGIRFEGLSLQDEQELAELVNEYLASLPPRSE